MSDPMNNSKLRFFPSAQPQSLDLTDITTSFAEAGETAEQNDAKTLVAQLTKLGISTVWSNANSSTSAQPAEPTMRATLTLIPGLKNTS